MHRYQNLMVALARPEAEAGLLRYAAMITGWGTARSVHFVQVLAGDGDSSIETPRDELLSRQRAAVEPYFSGLGVLQRNYAVLDGPLTDRLLTYAADNDINLLILGCGGSSSGRALARRLAMKAPCSVWIVPDGSPAAANRILVPIDFSESAADALRVAVSMAQRNGVADCLALHVYFNDAVITYEGYDQVLRGQEKAAYDKFLAAIDCDGVEVRPVFEEGAKVEHVIGRVAEREAADLIVMGTRGRSRSAAILLGSVTEQMISETKLPLLAVKHFGARLGVLQALLNSRLLTSPGMHTD